MSSLISSLNIGGNALAVNQAALQTTGNNIANAGNTDYTREAVSLGTTADTKIGPGTFVGNGVQLDGVARQIDEALESRLRSASSDNESSSTQQDWLGRVQSVFNELSDSDLSTKMSTFYNSWSALANKPQDAGLRQVVIQNGQSVTDWFHTINTNLDSLRTDLTTQTTGLAGQADTYASQIADLNGKIVSAESGGLDAQANGLRDQRDAVIKNLSGLMDIKTVDQPSGSENIYVGSQLLVDDTRSNGVTTKLITDAAGHEDTQVVFKSDGGALNYTSGQLGAMGKISDTLDNTVDQVNTLASSLTFELNKVYSSGQGLTGQTSIIGTNTVADATASLASTKSGLDQPPSNGSFVVHVKNKATGLESSTLIKVDIEGKPTDTSLNSLITQLDGVDGLTAVNNGGRLQISANDAPATELTFSQDSSGVLASLGVNTFFTGSNAKNIDINQTVVKDPSLLSASKNGDSADNGTATAIANLETTAVATLGGSTMEASYQSMINGLASQASTASSDATASSAVVQTLSNQREAISGVSMDEEAINLMKYQRAYQGAARLVTVVNEMMDTLMAMAT